jgi:hypothetical protein
VKLRKPVLAAALAAAALIIVSPASPAMAAPSIKKVAKQLRKLKRQVTGISQQQGPQGLTGLQGPQGPPGPSTGPAGGALAGNYPNPTLNVSGGPCPNGQLLSNVSALAALTCSAGVYSDGDSQNVAAGPTSFPDLTTGTGNSALGFNALVNNTTGGSNTALGFNALTNNTTGNDNTALGQSTLEDNTTGNGNTALGRAALLNTTGSGNVALGQQAGLSLTNGSGNIVIGNNGVAGESATIRIGSGHTRAFIDGIRGVTTDNVDAIPVQIDSAGQLGTVSSSRRVKRDIEPLGAPGPLMKLRPVSFRYREGAPDLHYGLLAEQVAKVLPELAVYGSDGLPETVQYQELPVLLLAKIQAQQRQINRLERLVRGR